MTRLLVVHHTPSPATAELLESVLVGATHPEITEVEVVCRAALAATASDLLAADGVILGTPANIGYMSGALKHFFDQVYYVCGRDTREMPYGMYVHGNLGPRGRHPVGPVDHGRPSLETRGASGRSHWDTRPDSPRRLPRLGALVAVTIAANA
jgi:hypothetical protein